jgi:hypothetical protein
METAEKIRKLGFRRWYERQLIEGHAYLVTCFLGMILVACALELSGFRAFTLDALLKLCLACVGAGLSIGAWQRYKVIMLRAEHMADGATCAKCGAYGVFTVLRFGTASAESQSSAPKELWLKVKCRKCANEWTI